MCGGISRSKMDDNSNSDNDIRRCNDSYSNCNDSNIIAGDITDLMLCSDRSHTFASLGALHSAYVEGKLESVRTFRACGSAAIPSLLLASGMEPRRISTVLINSNVFEDSADVRKETETLLTSEMIQLYGSVPTLGDLYTTTGKSLHLHVFDVAKQDVTTLSHESHPLMSCVSACCFAYGHPFRDYRQSYCGVEYTDCSATHPIPYFGMLGNNALCIYASPDVRSVPLLAPHKNTLESSWFISTQSRETFATTVKELNHNVRMQAISYARMLSLASGMLSLASSVGPKNISYTRLLVNTPNTTATETEKIAMIAKWREFLE